MEPPSGTPPSRQSSTPQPPLREDCWSEDATFALIEAWGERYLALGRGSLRQQHWLEVADAVNSAAESDDRPRRTDVQCKNRIDTLKKKYKVEKSRVLDSTGARHGGGYVSPWPYFASLDALIGSAFPVRKPSPETPPPARTMLPAVPVPVRPRSHNRSKRTPAHFSVERSLFQRRFFTATTEEEEREESEERSASRTRPRSGKGREDRRGGGFSELAETIERLAEIYERVERKKGREMIELEKQRMQFAKDLEQQRMRWFLETQLHLQKIHKKFKPSPIDGRYL